LDLRATIDQVVGRRTRCSIDLELGWPAEVIVREAERREPFLIALGLQPHRVLERVLYGGTALPVVRHASVPVLAATASMVATPRRIVVAVDFSRASLRAARIAAQLMADGGTLLLTHVTPELDYSAESTEGQGVVYSQGIVAAFARLIQELDAPANVSVQTMFLEGPVVPALLAFSGAAQADLIAVGTQRHRFMERLMVGSVTEALVRSARRSLLISPPPALSPST
jgi:nucleotide-binding universal stress UspA family protein